MENKIYTKNEIQKVYKRFHENPYAVVYSVDSGCTWQSPPMDAGKWFQGETPDTRQWIFAFIEPVQTF